MAAKDPIRRLARRLRPAPEPDPILELIEITEEDRRYLTTLHDETTPLPAGADDELKADNSRLRELRAAYAASGLPPATAASRWSAEAVESFLDLRYFRGESLITWHYRELPRVSKLKFFILSQHVRGKDRLGLLDRLGEDGGFGCWTFDFPGHDRVSRDLLESVNELSFLERQLAISERESFSVLDIGAGYGRLAHRFVEAFPRASDYCCVDAIAESTFVCDYYLRHRGVAPPARVVGLHEIDSELERGSFDLAVNIHSFSECPYEAVAWWIELLAGLDVPRLLIVPNHPTELLSLEADGTHRDFAPALEAAGYELRVREPVLDDPAVRSLVGVEDQFHLFERTRPG